MILDKGRQQWGQWGQREGVNSLPSKISIWGSFHMYLGTQNSFLASRIHFEDYFGQGAATVEAGGGANFLSSKITIWGSFPMFFGHGKLIFGI